MRIRGLLCYFLVCAVIVTIIPTAAAAVTDAGAPGIAFSGDGYALRPETAANTRYPAAEEAFTTYEIVHEGIPCGQFLLRTVALPNGDRYYCLRAEGTRDIAAPLGVSLALPVGPEYQYRYFAYPGGRDNTVSVLAGPEDAGRPLPPPYTAYVEGGAFSMVASCVSVYEKLDNGVLRDLDGESGHVTLSENRLDCALPVRKNRIAEHWGIVSGERLADFGDAEAVKLLRRCDFGPYRKWTMCGQYYLTPSSYIPSGGDCFYRNAGQHVGEKFLRARGRYFQDFALVALYTALREQDGRGIWPTQAASGWLLADYGIGPGFYDTRFNTDCARFLLRGWRVYGDPAMLAAAQRYAAFLAAHAATHQYPTENGGALVWDYAAGDGAARPTLVSLNHLVTEMNFLNELYWETRDAAHLALAEQIRRAVGDTAPDWVKENGDLWYARLPDGSYGREDYVNLTLRDLQYAQRMIARVHGEPDVAFAALIAAKEGYLRANNLPFS